MRKLTHGTTLLLKALLLSIPCIFVYGDDLNISPTINQDVPQWSSSVLDVTDNKDYNEVDEANGEYNDADEVIAWNENPPEEQSEGDTDDTGDTAYAGQDFGECCIDPCDVRARYHDNALQTIESCDCGGTRYLSINFIMKVSNT